MTAGGTGSIDGSGTLPPGMYFLVGDASSTVQQGGFNQGQVELQFVASSRVPVPSASTASLLLVALAAPVLILRRLVRCAR